MNERNYRIINKLNPREYRNFANDKALCKKVLEENNIPTPKTYCVIEAMREIEEKITSIEHLEDFVVKPAMGSGGQGILILKKTGHNQWSSPSGELYSRKALVMHVANILFGKFSKRLFDKVIIEYRLIPHSDFQKIFKRGVPDFRIILLNAQPVMAMLRMPTEESDGKANLHAGAIGLGVDLDTGRLKRGYNQITDQMVSRHPDSKVLFDGMKLPDWEKTLAISIATAKVFPLNYLGIDIVYDEKLGPMVIEINSRPGMQIQNVNAIGLKKVLEKIDF
ncbi:MAG: sugar-transfer associated ATP-grasp domain-containing protein [Sediminibacterium sp.]